MDQSKHLCPKGLCEDNVAKLDIAKLLKPKEWGWRFLAFDFVMPNHQLVECYIVFQELEQAKKSKDPRATVCPDLSNHELFEKWRVRDLAELAADERVEYEDDLVESNRRYDKAYATVLDHTSTAEKAAFWKPFCDNDDQLRETLLQLDALGEQSERTLPIAQTLSNEVLQALNSTGTNQGGEDLGSGMNTNPMLAAYEPSTAIARPRHSPGRAKA